MALSGLGFPAMTIITLEAGKDYSGHLLDIHLLPILGSN